MKENFALVQRPAPFTWEAQTQLLATTQETSAVVITFPRPVIIVAAYPSICAIDDDDALPVPTLDDLLVRIDQDTGIERRLTTRYDVVQNNGVGAQPSVTLGSYRDTTGGARVLDLELGSKDSRPDLQITFSWKRSVVGGPFYQDIIVGLAFHCDFL